MGDLCTAALGELAGRRGGPLFSRRETGLVARALLRPGGLDRLLADGRRVAVVARRDGGLVGMAFGRAEQVGEVPLGVVEGLYVRADARRSGVGTALLAALDAWFAATGCPGVDAGALPGDLATKSLLEGAGFKARLVVMHRATNPRGVDR